MKKTFFKTAVSAFALASISMAGNQLFAASIPVENWYAVNNRTDGVLPAPALSGGTTNSPLQENIGLNNLYMFSYFNPVTLQDGQSLKLEFTLTLDLQGDNPKKFTNYQFGLFNSSTHASGTRIKTTSAYAGTIKNWEGFLINKRGQFSSHWVEINLKKGGGDTSFVSDSDADPSLYRTAIASGTGGSTSGYNLVFNDGVPIDFSLIIRRDGDDLWLSGSVGGLNFGNGGSQLFVNGFRDSDNKLYNVFDAFGFNISGDIGEAVLINSAQFSNVNLNLIPEPSTAALLLMTLAALGMRRRRRA